MQGSRGNRQGQPAPEISVLMTVYNTEAYLREAVGSVFAQQTRRTWELILVDDGSSDGSLPLALELQAQHPDQIRVLRHPGGVNCGISKSRNLALSHARGAKIAFLDSDDVWLPVHLHTLTAILDRDPGVAGVFAEAERWFEFERPFDEAAARDAWWGSNYLPPLLPPAERAGIVPPGNLVNWFLHDESLVPCICSVMVRKEAARAVGGFVDEFHGLYDDQAFHAKLSLRYPLYAERTPVARYRKHSASCCAKGDADEVLCRTERRRFLRFLQEYRASLKSQAEDSCELSLAF